MWLDKRVSLYDCAADNRGRIVTFREVLLSHFAIEHEYYYKTYPDDKVTYPKGKWISGEVNDLNTMMKLRYGSLEKSEQVTLKQTMQCFTPAALLKSKKQGCIEEVERTGLMQLDFDYNDTKEYDIEELKQCVFSLPFVAFCGVSCSGKGFYALVAIAEPSRLNEYAEHCFKVLLEHGIKADTTKGRNINDLRFVSYDGNMLIRETPAPLLIPRLNQQQQRKEAVSNPTYQTSYKATGSQLNKELKVLQSGLKELSEVQPGNRWKTVQKVSYTIGGLGNSNYLFDIKSCINCNPSFSGEESKYIECAQVCFNEGITKPLPQEINKSNGYN
jgi:hypothetical protein